MSKKQKPTGNTGQKIKLRENMRRDPEKMVSENSV